MNNTDINFIQSSINNSSPHALAYILIFFGVFFIILLLIVTLMLVSSWKIYQKAERPGWASLVPFYNMFVLLEIVNIPTWCFILLFIPFVNTIIYCLISYHLALVFGQKNLGFTLGLIFLPFVFYPILAFGKYTYIKTIPPTEANISAV